MFVKQKNHNKFLKSFNFSCFVIDDNEHFSISNDHVDCLMINQLNEFKILCAKFFFAFFIY